MCHEAVLCQRCPGPVLRDSDLRDRDRRDPGPHEGITTGDLWSRAGSFHAVDPHAEHTTARRQAWAEMRPSARIARSVAIQTQGQWAVMASNRLHCRNFVPFLAPDSGFAFLCAGVAVVGLGSSR